MTSFANPGHRPRGSRPVARLAATVAAVMLGAASAAAQLPAVPAVPGSDAPALPPIATGPGGVNPAGAIPQPAPTVPAPPPGVPAPLNLYPGALRNPLLSPSPSVGTTPRPTPATQDKLAKLVEKLIDPETTLDLVTGQTRVLVLKAQPFRVQVGDEKVLSLNAVNTRELLLQGKDVGATVLTIWFGDPNEPTKQTTLTYLVRVFPDPEAKERLERAYKTLEDDINRFFKDTSVRLRVLGDKLVVSGRVRDYEQGAQVLRIVRANVGGGGPTTVGGNTGGGEAGKVPVIPAGAVGDPTGGANPPGLEAFQTAGGSNVINLLEVAGEQQVAMRVIVAEVNRAAARSIGMNFSVRNNQGVTVFANRTGPIFDPFGGASALANGLGGFGGGGFGGGGFGGGQMGGTIANLPINLDAGKVPIALHALRTLQYARSLAEPTLVTLNGVTANFLAGGQFPVPVTTGYTFSGLQGVQYVPYGVQLSFTPFITDRDRIKLVANINISTRDLSTGTNIGGSSVAGLNTRNVSTTIELRQGETMAVAGLIESNLGADSTRIPLLGDLPVIGPFAGINRTQAGEKELVIFITPELTRPLDPGQHVTLPGHEILDPNDVEFYLLNRLEGHCRDYRSPIRTDWSRIKQYRRVEDINVAGPSGYTAPGGQ